MRRRRWEPSTKTDYLWRPITSGETSGASSFDAADLDAALRRLPASAASHVAAIIYLQMGPWPPWIEYVAQSASANSANVAFYFVGPKLPNELAHVCAKNCWWLPAGTTALHHRMETLLQPLPPGATLFTSAKCETAKCKTSRKICDLKPLWPSLLPELSARHAWIGYADTDVVFGNLSYEVAALRPDDELLVPANFFPHPLANGNFLLMRSTPKMLRAYERHPRWRDMVFDEKYRSFDEWGSSEYGSMTQVYLDMYLAGELRPRPTTRLLVQDTIIVSFEAAKRQARFRVPHPGIEQGKALVAIWWRAGALWVEREGACWCSSDTIAQYGIATCHECLHEPGARLHNVSTHRRFEAFAFHFQLWKKEWRQQEYALLAKNNGTRPAGAVWSFPAPSCGSFSKGFELYPGGFRCSTTSEAPTAGCTRLMSKRSLCKEFTGRRTIRVERNAVS